MGTYVRELLDFQPGCTEAITCQSSFQPAQLVYPCKHATAAERRGRTTSSIQHPPKLGMKLELRSAGAGLNNAQSYDVTEHVL